jgi:hypothetical protein
VTAFDDAEAYRMEEWLTEYLEHELRRLAEQPAFEFLARNGDAIEARVRECLAEAEALSRVGFPGACLVRAAAGIEVAIHFFLTRPLLQGAFLSDEWAELLTARVFGRRTAEDRKLLPAILRNWGIDITAIALPQGGQLWETIVERVWRARNRYVHAGGIVAASDADVAIACLSTLLDEVVADVARRLGFTREWTNRWSLVAVENPPAYPYLNPPREYVRESPF